VILLLLILILRFLLFLLSESELRVDTREAKGVPATRED
jgi:hypothetical protein